MEDKCNTSSLKSVSYFYTVLQKVQ